MPDVEDEARALAELRAANRLPGDGMRSTAQAQVLKSLADTAIVRDPAWEKRREEQEAAAAALDAELRRAERRQIALHHAVSVGQINRDSAERIVAIAQMFADFLEGPKAD